MTWLKGTHCGEIFGGQAAIELMVEGGLDGILNVRRYLDTWPSGRPGGPGEGKTDGGIGHKSRL
ncbi:hypothetical protein LR948_11150 [Roseivivax sp. GX 12232]|uniref:hypothetical protein n=1 Tax=Roseivivax sp. GX 12232 TaxID=2900547 RepID=UPI001E44A53A|nr:hypothetical protein [Roseivivax sp. GX 12232]MCE0505916.1 hypothetical protein [Roseivivax sp. GX 12232]